ERDGSGTDLVRVEREIAALRDTAAEKTTLEERLKGLHEKGGPDAAKLNAAHESKARRDRERQALEALGRDMPSAAHELETALGSMLTRLESRLAPDMLAGPNEKI